MKIVARGEHFPGARTLVRFRVAQYLISRDPDLLGLRKPFGVEIVTDQQFLKLVVDF